MTSELNNLQADISEEEALLSAITNMDIEGLKKKTKAKVEKDAPPSEDAAARQKLDEQLAIYDALVTKGFYEESFKIGKRISGMWRSRTTGQSNTIYKLVDAAGFNSGMAVNNYLNLLNISYSLVAFGGDSFLDKPVSERLKVVENMPEVLIIALSKSLVEFDAKLREVVEVGQANF